MIELELVGVRVELPHNQPIVLLKEIDGPRYLPIWIGADVATAIAFAVQGVTTPRPMTHDLVRDVLAGLDVAVERVVITEMRESTFYAELHLTTASGSVVVSSRPSDAIAIAARTGATIYADEQVVSDLGIEIDDDPEEEVQQFKDFIDNVTAEDFK